MKNYLLAGLFAAAVIAAIIFYKFPVKERPAAAPAWSTPTSSAVMEVVPQPEQESEPAPKRLSAEDIPPSVSAYFNARNCHIEYPDYKKYPHHVGIQNLIVGEFAVKGQRDWAALCTDNNHRLYISVLWGGPVHCNGTLAVFPEKPFLGKSEEGKIIYRREITLYNEANFFMPEEDHDVIADSDFRERGQGTMLHYCYQGKWKKTRWSD